MVRKAIEEADYHQDKGIGNHHRLVAYTVDKLAHQRREYEARYRRYGEQQAYDACVRAVEEHKHIRPEGEKHLLAGAVEHLQHIVFAELLAEVEAPARRVRGTVSAQAEGDHGGRRHKDGRCYEEMLERLGGGHQREHRYHRQVSCQVSNLVHGVLIAQRPASGPALGVLQRQRIAHPQLNMLSHRINEDGQDHQSLGRGDERLHCHPDDHHAHSQLVHLLCGKDVQHRQHHHQEKARQLAEEFRYAAVHLRHLRHLRQIIVYHTLIQSVSYCGQQQRNEQRLVSCSLLKNRIHLPNILWAVKLALFPLIIPFRCGRWSKFWTPSGILGLF